MRLTKVMFSLSSKSVDVKDILKRIDLPEGKLWYPKLPQYADPEWFIEVKSMDAAIETPLFELQNLLAPKMDVIVELCNHQEIESMIGIIIKAECYAARPEISLPSSIFPFFEKLNAEVCFDMLYNEDLEEEIGEIWEKYART